jgi:hypothetical protein
MFSGVAQNLLIFAKWQFQNESWLSLSVLIVDYKDG